MDCEGQGEDEDQNSKEHNLSEGTDDSMHMDTIEREMTEEEDVDNDKTRSRLQSADNR